MIWLKPIYGIFLYPLAKANGNEWHKTINLIIAVPFMGRINKRLMALAK
jgi:hypothetical protein